MPKDANLDLVEPDCGEVNCSESLSRDDVIAPANNDNRIVFASLYTYADEKDESAFKKILLPQSACPQWTFSICSTSTSAWRFPLMC